MQKLMLMQFIGEFIIEGVDMLECIVNPNKPQMDLTELNTARNDFEHGTSTMHEELMQKMKPMNKQFLEGQGDLNSWPDEVLKAIDDCFVAFFMEGGKPAAYLFHMEAVVALDKFQKYCDAVACLLKKNKKKLPEYTLEYFTFFSIWKMQKYKFPMPLMTASAVGCLIEIASKIKRGFTKVSGFRAIYELSSIGGSTALGSHLLRGMLRFCGTAARMSCLLCGTHSFFGVVLFVQYSCKCHTQVTSSARHNLFCGTAALMSCLLCGTHSFFGVVLFAQYYCKCRAQVTFPARPAFIFWYFCTCVMSFIHLVIISVSFAFALMRHYIYV